MKNITYFSVSDLKIKENYNSVGKSTKVAGFNKILLKVWNKENLTAYYLIMQQIDE